MFELDNAKSTLKILGILAIIFGVLEIISGILVTAGGSLLSTMTVAPEDAAAASAASGLLTLLGVLTLIQGIVYLLLGIFSVRASNDFSKIGPAYIFSIIALALAIIGLILNIFSDPTVSNILSGIVGIVFAGAIFWAAKTIKEAA